MKNRLIKTVLFIVIGSSGLIGQNLWTEHDRAFLLEGLEKTKSDLLSEIELLDEYQAFYKPDTNSWSIGKVIEHLGVYEEHLYWDLLYQQHSPERPELAKQVKGNDESLLSYATDVKANTGRGYKRDREPK